MLKVGDKVRIKGADELRFQYRPWERSPDAGVDVDGVCFNRVMFDTVCGMTTTIRSVGSYGGIPLYQVHDSSWSFREGMFEPMKSKYPTNKGAYVQGRR